MRTGCSWRQLPHDFPPWRSVFHRYAQWSKEGVIEAIHNHLRCMVRVAAGRAAEPSAAILDSQSVKTTDVGGPRGYDAGKKNQLDSHRIIPRVHERDIAAAHGACLRAIRALKDWIADWQFSAPAASRYKQSREPKEQGVRSNAGRRQVGEAIMGSVRYVANSVEWCSMPTKCFRRLTSSQTIAYIVHMPTLPVTCDPMQ